MTPVEEPGTSAPAVSVILAAYASHRTLAGSLSALAGQTFRDFEAIVVDSGMGEESAAVAATFPWVRYERSARRLLPHAARNRGAALARGEILVFSDPDVYAGREWLERLVAAHRGSGEPIVGALACHGERWLDEGIHLCKFSKWLPGGPPRPLDMGPTANLLVPRADFRAAGGFPGELLLGDVVLSERLRKAGRLLLFEPAAIVSHHHLHDLRSFLAERLARGRLFGELRARRLADRPAALLGYLLATLLPLRLPRILALVALHAARAGQLRRYALTLPLVLLGHAASLAGEASSYTRHFRNRTARRLGRGRWAEAER